MRGFILAGVSLFALAGAVRSFADVVVMDDGRRIRGELVSVNRGLVLFDEIREGTTRKNRLRLEKDQVRRIVLRDEQGDDLDGGDDRYGDRSDRYGRNDGYEDRSDREGRYEDGGDRPGDRRENDDDILYRDGDRTRGDGSRPASGRPGTVTVSARQAWTDTGLDVRAGDILSFAPEGAIQWGRGREDGPAGETNSPIDQRRPIPARPGGALIGRIGASSTDVFFIGNDRGSFRVRNGGRLFLGVNDDYFGDNSGSFQVRITR